MKNKFDGYIPTPLRRRLGIPAPAARFSSALLDRIDSTGGNASCWPWVGPVDRDGYGVVTRSGRAHRLAWQEHHGRELTPAEVVRHSCDNPCCCNPAHLILGTQIENIDDRVQKGRSAKGSSNGRAKLAAKTVIDIYCSKEPVCATARKHGVDESTVRNIRSGKTWGWLTESYSKDSLEIPKLSDILR